MDNAVVQSMARWPNVPACYGWLELSQRGEWRLGAAKPREKVSHAGLADFIGRNYSHDGDGCWFMQNGPQRVFAILEYTPWVFHLSADGRQLLAHSGSDAGIPDAAWLDDEGNLLLQTALGIGLLDDRDLPAVLPHLCALSGATLADKDLEAWLAQGIALPPAQLLWQRQSIPLTTLRRQEVAQRFGFNPAPAPGL